MVAFQVVASQAFSLPRGGCLCLSSRSHALPSRKIIENTENRWDNNPADIDLRTKKACENIKKDVFNNIKVYMVRVIEGNASLLQSCASKPDMYFDVQNASQLNAVFKQISENLASLRISK